MKDDDIEVLANFSEDHPANYDQQLETVRELLSKAEAWIFVGSVPEIDDVKGSGHRIHAVLGGTPGTSMGAFLIHATEAYNTLINSALEHLQDDNEEEPLNGE